MVPTGNAADGRSFVDRVGEIMHRVVAIAFAAASLATSLGGCSSMSWDSLKPGPTMVDIRLESSPPGADAKTSLGPGCKTPCSVAVAAPDGNFSVAFSLDKFLPETVQVQVTHNSGVFNTSPPYVFDPNPVVAELQPAPPPPKPVRHHHPKQPKPAKTAAAPAAAPTADSAFPAPDAAQH
jgi:hypothetical protein